MHSYTTAFAVSAALFAVGAIVAGLMYEPHAAHLAAASEAREAKAEGARELALVA